MIRKISSNQSFLWRSSSNYSKRNTTCSIDVSIVVSSIPIIKKNGCRALDLTYLSMWMARWLANTFPISTGISISLSCSSGRDKFHGMTFSGRCSPDCKNSNAHVATKNSSVLSWTTARRTLKSPTSCSKRISRDTHVVTKKPQGSTPTCLRKVAQPLGIRSKSDHLARPWSRELRTSKCLPSTWRSHVNLTIM